jgi:hypothetical protein
VPGFGAADHSLLARASGGRCSSASRVRRGVELNGSASDEALACRSQSECRRCHFYVRFFLITVTGAARATAVGACVPSSGAAREPFPLQMRLVD